MMQEIIDIPKQELLANLFDNWKCYSKLLVQQLKVKVNRQKMQLQKSKKDKQQQAKRVKQKQEQMNRLSKSLYELSMKRKKIEEENDKLRGQISQQRKEILALGRPDAHDYELMAKEIQQEIYIQQKDKIQSLIDKKVDVLKTMNH